MKFSKPSDRIAATWTLDTGVAQTGYDVDKINTTALTIDPSDPLWIVGTSLRVVADLGSATEVTAVALINHTFDEGLDVRFQMHATNTWGAPTVDELVTIPEPYANGYGCHAFLDLAATVPSAATRTKRYLSVANLSPNSVTVALGEIWVCGADGWRALESYDIRHDYQQAYGQVVVAQESRRGVQTRYDLGTRTARIFTVSVRADTLGLEQLLDWFDECHGAAKASLIALDPASALRRHAEPRLALFQTDVVAASVKHEAAYDVPLTFEELADGEPIQT